MDTPSALEPTLTQAQAFGLLIVYCFVYILPLHASAATRASANRSRDAPEAIRARIRSVSVSTALCSLVTLLVLVRSGSIDSALHRMGYWPLGLTEAAKALLLTGLLFAGPLYECLLVDGVWTQWLRLEPLRQVWAEWPPWRNMVAGPVTEECLFRSAAVPLLLLAGTTVRDIVFYSPLIFGLAHLHHFYEFRITHPQTPLAVAIARSVLQLMYTSIFGAYATFIFLRTGSLLAAISIHTLCNCMGLPRLWGAVEPYWLTPSMLSRPGSVLTWTTLYYALLLGGSTLWWLNLYSLTRSPMSLIDF
ncbi:putative CAAX prenyl protease 2 [Drechmeria coniospora]|uniref:intramembrane prenyl-peptidase Rce1 n=1 Tax=Drechmeria coniospora TaxID=98403 RepID=A0A151GXS7_DRECN|nr:putative CAAX prenyl protease 2 [Drechmeria coniospora]KYK61909.1 putative CAAX prenyl protease 2 [Drechmeria coniospora]